jgi:hypothetical protein
VISRPPRGSYFRPVLASQLGLVAPADDALSDAVGYLGRKRLAPHDVCVRAQGSTVPLLLGAVGILSRSAAGWAAIGLGLAVLGTEGLVFARAERLRPLATLGVVALNLGLGLVLVALKVIVTH